jgi:hypothetical protein
MTEKNFIVYTHHIFFNYSSVEEHQVRFHTLAMVYSVATNMDIQVYQWYIDLHSVVYMFGSDIAGSYCWVWRHKAGDWLSHPP